MRIVYQALFRVRLRHLFYPSGSSDGDFVAEPAPETARALAGHGLVFRPLADGWAVYAEVEPGSSPPRLLRPLGEDGLRLAFALRPAHAHVWSISELPGYRPGRDVFCFDNLRDDQEGGRLHLGDAVAGARVGAAVPLVSGESLTYGFTPAVDAATLTIDDRFGDTAATAAFSSPEPTSEYRLDLAAARLAPGRYTVSDDHGGSLAFYYDPELSRRPFGVVEIFSDPVPAAYRFLDGDELTGAGDYTLQLAARATSWRFNVIKKYAAGGFAPADLTIAGPVTFDKAVEPDRAVFTSAAAVALSAGRQQALVLMENSNEIRDLPNPGAATPLAAGAAPGSFVSEMYVYV